jgi:hypothetical protein
MADGEGVFAGCDAAIADDSAAGFAGGTEIAGEMAVAGAAVGADEVAGFAADVAETGCKAPSAGGGAIEMLARVLFPDGAATEFEDPVAEAGETFE